MEEFGTELTVIIPERGWTIPSAGVFERDVHTENTLPHNKTGHV